MEYRAFDPESAGAKVPFFLAYIADLELEVDRLRSRRLILHETRKP